MAGSLAMTRIWEPVMIKFFFQPHHTEAHNVCTNRRVFAPTATSPHQRSASRHCEEPRPKSRGDVAISQRAQIISSDTKLPNPKDRRLFFHDNINIDSMLNPPFSILLDGMMYMKDAWSKYQFPAKKQNRYKIAIVHIKNMRNEPIFFITYRRGQLSV